MNRQRGVILLASLVLMLALGLLGASALQGALLQQRMAGNLAVSLRGLEQAEATLAVGEMQLPLALPAPCTVCLAPVDAHDDAARSAQAWRSTRDGFYLLQNLGPSLRAVHRPIGRPVTLFRITAVSRADSGRQVLESVVALEEGGAPLRIMWRQRLREE
ncbi:hypothetical protein PS627_02191 [Pseudomonas fluorescens]|uniref:pilus assembly PilX family protein n=1 Tax=Pseudomonas fluorescens TaxID=294 RepID=UPI001251107E|nr:hypothetical protein [Pseudomonas fluorescens]CAG8866919.1 hypothetical protein PS627_02191 [Pseudomonas fluorescens]VVP78874.1 hypothetical protein PS910_01777 [Pseudomonas fluorescens]